LCYCNNWRYIWQKNWPYKNEQSCNMPILKILYMEIIHKQTLIVNLCSYNTIPEGYFNRDLWYSFYMFLSQNHNTFWNKHK
jgi:hypothetical protein